MSPHINTLGDTDKSGSLAHRRILRQTGTQSPPVVPWLPCSASRAKNPRLPPPVPSPDRTRRNRRARPNEFDQTNPIPSKQERPITSHINNLTPNTPAPSTPAPSTLAPPNLGSLPAPSAGPRRHPTSTLGGAVQHRNGENAKRTQDQPKAIGINAPNHVPRPSIEVYRPARPAQRVTYPPTPERLPDNRSSKKPSKSNIHLRALLSTV